MKNNLLWEELKRVSGVLLSFFHTAAIMVSRPYFVRKKTSRLSISVETNFPSQSILIVDVNTCITDCWWRWWPCFQWMNAGIFLCTAGGEKRLHEKDKTPTIQRLLSNQQDMEALSSIQSMTCTKHIHDSTQNTKLISLRDHYLRWKARPWPWTSLLRGVSRMSWRVSGVVARVPWVPLLSWIAGVAGVAPAIRGSWGALQQCQWDGAFRGHENKARFRYNNNQWHGMFNTHAWVRGN